MESIRGLLYRVVESQEKVATMELVDSLSEQCLLEEMLESSKPSRQEGSSGLHYLLSTPFRYPPLPWGSRFGRTFEPGLFYGSLSVEAVQAELAFYRLVFLDGLEEPFPEPVSSQHSIFSARYSTRQGLRLQGLSWQQYRRQLVNPVDYGFCQHLGSLIREQGVTAFEFLSARALQVHPTPDGVTDSPGPSMLNVALVTPEALASVQPESQQKLLVRTTLEGVSLSLVQADGTIRFSAYDAASFFVDGQLPRPA